MIQHASIETFEGGVAPAVDPADLAPGTASEALDTDPRGLGRLRGRPADIVRLVGIRADVLHDARRLGGLVLIDNDARRVWMLADGATSPSLVTRGVPGSSNFAGRVLPGPFEMPSGGVVFSVDGGAPLYVGPVRAQLGAGASGLVMAQAPLVAPDNQPVAGFPTPVTGTPGSPGFEGGFRYFWRASILFDGFQEGPLGKVFAVMTARESLSGVTLTVTVNNPSGLSRRATHLNLYRAQAALGEPGEPLPAGPDSAYRLVASIPLDPALAADIEGVERAWYYHGGYAWRVDFRDSGFEGPAFEENAGFPETLKDHRIAVTAAAQGGPFFFKVGRAEADDSEGVFLYRSLPGQPDVTDWSRDYVALPESPVAQVFHDGLIYAASRRTLYAVDAATLALVRSWPGVGAAGPQALCAGPHGVFVAGDDTLWLVTAAGPARVGLPVERGRESWGETVGDAHCAYDGASGLYVAVRRVRAAGPMRAFLLDAETGRFWVATVPVHEVHGVAAAPSGRVFVSGLTWDGTFHLVELMASGARRPWSWTSHRMAFPVESLDFKPYHLKVAVSSPGAPLPNLAASLDGGAFESLPYDGAAARPLPAGGPSRAGRASFPRDAGRPRPRARSVRVNLNGSSSTEVASLTLVYRTLPPR